MQISHVAGFGPVVRDVDASRRFWGDDLGIALAEQAPDYFTNESLDGVRYFGLWPLSQAAQATFATDAWPDDVPAPTSWIELDVASAEAVTAALDELAAAGHRVLRGTQLEPWGQTTSRLLSPEGLLVGITFTPWQHEGPAPA
jgi:catechol 2,3-dioxygenase-like lactoylglutathione lyase family enzyme